LFYEWLQIFVVSALLFTFYVPFHVGKQLHQKSYYSLEETTNRCKTIATADMFIDGSFGDTELDSIHRSKLNEEEYINEYENDYYDGKRDTNYHFFRKDHIVFGEKKYNQFSLV